VKKQYLCRRLPCTLSKQRLVIKVSRPGLRFFQFVFFHMLRENRLFSNNFAVTAFKPVIICPLFDNNAALNQHPSCLYCNADEQCPASLNETRILIILYLLRIAIFIFDGCGMS